MKINMSDEEIRNNIMGSSEWKGTLIGFEKCICEVDLSKHNYLYGIRQKGTDGFSDDMFTTLRMTSIESLVAFMQGALWFRLHGNDFKRNMKGEK